MFEDIYQLIDKFKNADVESMLIEKGTFRLRLEQDDVHSEEVSTSDFSSQEQGSSRKLAAPQKSSSIADSEIPSETKQTDEQIEEDPNLIKVCSPAVGFFHVKTPTAQQADGEGENVYVGLHVKEGELLCYIRANEYQYEVISPVTGVVVRSDSHEDDFIEYDQVLYEIRKIGGDHV